MKHNFRITIYLILLYFFAQMAGLMIINQYVDHKTTTQTGNVTYSDLPYDMERPPVEDKSTSWIYIVAAILFGTVLMFILIKFRKPVIWKAWFFLAILACLLFAFFPFLRNFPAGESIAFGIALLLTYLKVFKNNIWTHNITEIFIYGGLASILVPIINVLGAAILLLAISMYDMFAVWKSKHMVKLAKFQTESKLFAGLNIPYDKSKSSGKQLAKKHDSTPESKATYSKNAVLGGGDIGFPLIFSGAVMAEIMPVMIFWKAFLLTSIISVSTTVALFLLLYYAKKDRFYPAMPFLSFGCLAGYLIILLLTI